MAADRLKNSEARTAMKKGLMIGLGILALTVTNVGLSLLLTDMWLLNAEPEAVTETGAGDKPAAPKRRVAVKKKDLEPAIYVPLEPAFTANFGAPGSGRYISLQLEAMTRDPKVESALHNHLPAIRNSILLLLGGLTSADVADVESKDALRGTIRDAIRKTLMRNGAESGIEQVFFTSLVLQ